MVTFITIQLHENHSMQHEILCPFKKSQEMSHRLDRVKSKSFVRAVISLFAVQWQLLYYSVITHSMQQWVLLTC